MLVLLSIHLDSTHLAFHLLTNASDVRGGKYRCLRHCRANFDLRQ